MKRKYVATLAAVGPVLAAAGGMLTATPASASFTAQSDHLVFHVQGAGLFVDYFLVTIDSSHHGFFEISGPKQLTGPTGSYTQGQGHLFNVQLDVPAGLYCGAFWEGPNSNGSFSKFDEACGRVS
jgi:hypothetical protein